MAETIPNSVLDILRKGQAFLEGKAVQEPRQICELLLSRLFNCKRLELYVRYETVLSEKKLDAMRRGIKRAAAGEPVQYILGQVDFMGRTLKVDRRALIPRPETEELVEFILGHDALWQAEHPAVVDIGTGSGCIVLSLATARPEARYLGVDVSAEAIELAQENAASLGLDAKVLFAAAELPDVVEPESFDAVVANLPYVPTAEYEQLPVHIREHEPRSALDGGPDGLAVIMEVVQDAAMVLKPKGAIFLEIAEDQGDRVKSLLEEAGFTDVLVKRDLAGHDRIVFGHLAPLV